MTTTATETYNRDYYVNYCGDFPYLHSSLEFHNFFNDVADRVVLSLAPRKVFDAGCAIGFMVEKLWDRGVETHGRDISEFANSQVRADVRPWCEVGSIAAPIDGQYDLVLCIEVLEHMPADEALAAIRNLTGVAPRILFSSSPTDLKEKTHINVRPTRYWLERFAEAGFAPVVGFDATFLCPHAMLLERSDQGRDERSLAAFAEIVRQRLKVAETREAEQRSRRALEQDLAALRTAEARARAELRDRAAAMTVREQKLEQALQQEIARADSNARIAHRDQAAAAEAALADRTVSATRVGVMRTQLDEAQSRLRTIESSTAWRFARALQRMSGWLPLPRRSIGRVWSTGAGLLPGQKTLRLRNEQAAAAIRATGLFDDSFYLKNNPDIAANGIDPALHFADHGWREDRKPSAGFDPAFYLKQNPDLPEGTNPLLHFARHGRDEGRSPTPPIEDLVASEAELMPEHDSSDSGPVEESAPPEARPPSARSLIQTRCASWAPMPVFADPRAPATITILTDSIDPNLLFGGVGTSLVMGALMARRMNARLRLATRHEAADPAALGEVLRANRLRWEGSADFVHLPENGDRPLPLGDGDVILTTSWWSTRTALGSVDAARIVYLLQEDERMFYPQGDVRLRCAETLSEPDVRVVVNTRMLFDHLADGPEPLPKLRDRGLWFDPAFPAFPRPQGGEARAGKKNFFFYARPTNDRNLYWRGLEVIDTAMREGLLPADEWEIHFAGRDLPEMELPDAVRPVLSQKLPWSAYAELVSRMDLGLCLMDTPHPSYPPLDLAAAGAVVVTNTHGPKQSLEGWSRNIIAAPPSVAGLVDAMRRGVRLAENRSVRLANCAADAIPRDWEAQLGPVVDRLLAARG